MMAASRARDRGFPKTEAVIGALEAVNKAIAGVAKWAVLVAVLVCASVVVLRYGFNTGFVWMQELYVWAHATAIMLGLAYTFLAGGHVRVEILSARFSARTRAAVEIAGNLLFLLPWIVVILLSAYPYTAASFKILESSHQSGGMLGLFLLKAELIAFGLLLLCQGVASTLRNLLILTGHPASENQARN